MTVNLEGCIYVMIAVGEEALRQMAHAIGTIRKNDSKDVVILALLHNVNLLSAHGDYVCRNATAVMLDQYGKSTEDIFGKGVGDRMMAMMSKMLIPVMLKNENWDRAVYLDNDIRVVGSLEKLRTAETTHGLAAVPDGFANLRTRFDYKPRPMPRLTQEELDTLERPLDETAPYVNTGVIVFERSKLPETYERRIMHAARYLGRVGETGAPDQDAMNMEFDFDVLDDRFNYDPKKQIHDDVRLVHYFGSHNKAELMELVNGFCNSLGRENRKMKIVVYAISKNESKFVSRWMASMREADEVVVLDTGSTDDTVELLRKEGAKVEVQTFTPWRFDTSRNASIDLANRLVPDADLLVCTDLDEFFLPGWREKLETAFTEATRRAENAGTALPTTAEYEYVWNINADGSDGTKFWYEKIHTPRSGARWTHPVHEILSYDRQKVMVHVDGMRLEHHADQNKSRAQYLQLLEMSVEEAPMDDRNMHYLGREYMFRGMWDKCIETLERHLALPTARWNAERAASMRFIARCYGEKKDEVRKELWLWRAVHEAPEQREAPIELAEMFHERKDFQMLVRACEICLSRKNRQMSYLTKAEAWGSRPYDLYCVGLWYTGRRAEAMSALEEALKYSPNDTRLLNNRKVMSQMMGAHGES